MIDTIMLFLEPPLGDSNADKAAVARQVETILSRIETKPKPLAWKLRARLGDRVKWYKDGDEVK